MTVLKKLFGHSVFLKGFALLKIISYLLSAMFTISFPILLNLTKNVSIHTGISHEELKLLYKKAHFFLLASISNEEKNAHTETQGVVLQEAQAAGCIPIASRVGGIPEVLHDRLDAYLVKQKCSKEIYLFTNLL